MTPIALPSPPECPPLARTGDELSAVTGRPRHVGGMKKNVAAPPWPEDLRGSFGTPRDQPLGSSIEGDAPRNLDSDGRSELEGLP